MPGPHRLAKQERRHNEGKWRVWQVLGGRGLEGTGLHSGPSAHVLHTQSQHSIRSGSGEVPSLQKPGGAQARKCLQKVGLFGDVTLYKQLGTNLRGRNGFLCFPLLTVKRGGRQ